MINRILPPCIDNRYRGHRLALWLFIPITFQKLGVSLTHLFKADGGAQSISTIPLDTYSRSAAQNVVGLFARMGLEQPVLGALFVLILLRHRAMIPLLYLLIVAHYLASRGVAQLKPLVLAGTSGARFRRCGDPLATQREPQQGESAATTHTTLDSDDAAAWTASKPSSRSLVTRVHRTVIALLCAIASTLEAQGNLEGRWEGVWTRSGASLAVSFDFQRSDSSYAGVFGSTQLRVSGIPLSKVSRVGSRVRFEVVGDRTTMAFDGVLENDRISGSFTEGDARGAFNVRKTPSSGELAYREEAVTFANGETTLAGSLLIPNDRKKRHPAIVFLHGSGPEDRYASRFLADLFARRGIATLIYDKRGVGSSKGDWRSADFETLAQDAVAAVASLRSRKDIDYSRIGIYGHSQGAAIAPLVAPRAKAAFVIASAASGIRADDGERYSLRNSLRASNLTPTEAAEAERFIDLVIESGRRGARSLELDSAVARDSMERWFFPVPPGDNYYWAFSKAIATYDPSRYWADVHVPVLLLYGELDQRVAVTESIRRIRTALHAANNRRYTIKVFPNADHTMRVTASRDGGFHWPDNPPGYLETLLNWTVGTATK